MTAGNKGASVECSGSIAGRTTASTMKIRVDEFDHVAFEAGEGAGCAFCAHGASRDRDRGHRSAATPRRIRRWPIGGIGFEILGQHAVQRRRTRRARAGASVNGACVATHGLQAIHLGEQACQGDGWAAGSCQSMSRAALRLGGAEEREAGRP